MRYAATASRRVKSEASQNRLGSMHPSRCSADMPLGAQLAADFPKESLARKTT
jgi:hypothetical protein